MKRSLFAAVLVSMVVATPALAAPGDPRVVQGTLQWPASVSTEPFVVVRGDDGQLYYADIASAQRRLPGPLAVGTRLSVLGVEGSRPWEISAVALGGPDATATGLIPSAPLPATSPETATAPAPSPDLWRVDGTVQSVAGTMVTLRTPNGRPTTVDVSPLSESTVRALRPGERISLFGEPRADRKLVANGFIQSEPMPPAASPPSR